MLSFIGAAALFIGVLSVLVIIHEWGHFAAARLFGIKVEEFGFGFGPRLFGVYKRGTLYSVNALPLGGFVRLKGEDGSTATDSDSFASKRWWQKGIVIIAGVTMNIVLAVVLFTAGFTFGMPQIIDDEHDTKNARNVSIQVTMVKQDSPASRAGILVGDSIATLDGTAVESVEHIRAYTSEHIGSEVILIVKRGTQEITMPIIPELLKETRRGGIGVGIARIGIVSYPIHESVVLGIKATWNMAQMIVVTLVAAFRQLAFDDVVGPVGIATYTASIAKLGIAYLIGIVAQLSISLAIFNILPLPALDGGRILFIVLERIRGRSMNIAIENAIHIVGFIVLITLVLLVTARDISRIFSS